jgi:xanthine/CO dehydrogenase XdhC/CoxF family maturation factor
MQDDTLSLAHKWAEEGRQLALATVVNTWGSAPRKAGSHLVVDVDRNFEGSVSGGCVEGAVIAEALDIIQSGEPKLLKFGVDDKMAWEAGLACGGTIEVYVERID